MKIKGVTMESGHAYIPAIFACAKFQIFEPIVLFVDTMASTTTVLEGDAERLGINFEDLERSKDPTMVAGGTIYPYILRDVTLIFRTTRGRIHGERLEMVDVIKPTKKSVKRPWSILGVDVISGFKRMIYDKNSVLLEK